MYKRIYIYILWHNWQCSGVLPLIYMNIHIYKYKHIKYKCICKTIILFKVHIKYAHTVLIYLLLEKKDQSNDDVLTI